MTNESKKENIELILGDYKKAIRKLSWPIVVSLLISVSYNFIDCMWVAKLGSNELAAMGLILPLYFVFVAFGSGLATGVNSLIARYIGARNFKNASNSAVHGIFLTIIASILLAIVMNLSLPYILALMHTGSATTAALEYGNIIFNGAFVLFYSNVGIAILRSEGDVKRGMYLMTATTILNIILDPIFIFNFNMGIGGAAWATIITETINCIVLIYWIISKRTHTLMFHLETLNITQILQKRFYLLQYQIHQKIY